MSAVAAAPPVELTPTAPKSKGRRIIRVKRSSRTRPEGLHPTKPTEPNGETNGEVPVHTYDQDRFLYDKTGNLIAGNVLGMPEEYTEAKAKAMPPPPKEREYSYMNLQHELAHAQLQQLIDIASEPVQEVLYDAFERKAQERLEMQGLVAKMEEAALHGQNHTATMTATTTSASKSMGTLRRRATGLMLNQSQRMGPDTFLEGRNERAFEAWERQQRLWRGVRRAVASNSDKLETQLVMESGSYWRTKIEQLQQLELSVPAQEHHGSDHWVMSLRNNWTRYMPVGNIFSGLFCEEDQRRSKDDVERIGNPQLQEELLEATATRTLQMSGSKTSRMAHANALDTNREAQTPQIDQSLREGLPDIILGADRGRGWATSSYLQHRKKQYAKQLEDIAPHNPTVEDFRALQIQGQSVLETLREMSSQPILVEEIEKDIRVSDPQGWDVLISYYKEQAEKLETETTKADHARRLQEAAEEAATKEAFVKQGPALDLQQDTVRLSCSRGESTMATVTIKNTGTTALYYTWHPESCAGTIPHATWGDNASRLFLASPEGVLLPDESKELHIIFRSTTAGIFQRSWQLKTLPELRMESEEDHTLMNPVITAHAIATQEAIAGKRKRDALHQRLAEQEKHRTVNQIIDSLISKIPEPRKTAELYEIPLSLPPPESAFLAANAKAQPPMYYSQAVVEALEELSSEIIQASHEAESSKDGKPTEEKGQNGEEQDLDKNADANGTHGWQYSLVKLRGMIEKAVSDNIVGAEVETRFEELCSEAVVPADRSTLNFTSMYHSITRTAAAASEVILSQDEAEAESKGIAEETAIGTEENIVGEGAVLPAADNQVKTGGENVESTHAAKTEELQKTPEENILQKIKDAMVSNLSEAPLVVSHAEDIITSILEERIVRANEAAEALGTEPATLESYRWQAFSLHRRLCALVSREQTPVPFVEVWESRQSEALSPDVTQHPRTIDSTHCSQDGDDETQSYAEAVGKS